MNKERLLKVAQALRESPAPEDFYMGGYGNSCGTPMCALGHYAWRRDLNEGAFQLTPRGELRDSDGEEVCVYGPGSQEIADHFGLSPLQLTELFGAYGCADAQTPEDAATYIEDFVRHNEATS